MMVTNMGYMIINRIKEIILPLKRKATVVFLLVENIFFWTQDKIYAASKPDDRGPDSLFDRFKETKHFEINLFLIIVFLVVIAILMTLVLVRGGQRKKLDYMAHRDGMTGVYNRRAYEEALAWYSQEGVEPDFVYASFDVNDLKGTNDTFGHKAGDELILGSAQCLLKVFGQYGKIYRLGGDEFVAIFLAKDTQLDKLKEDLQLELRSWKGDYINGIHLSCGYVTKREFSQITMEELAKYADQRMYRDKLKKKKQSHQAGALSGINAMERIAQSQEEKELFRDFLQSYEMQYDLLTGLPTRSYFIELAKELILTLTDETSQVAVVAFNFNGFKSFNSRYGLEEGDKLLISFAEILTMVFGRDYTSRFGEDQFYAIAKRREVEEKLYQIFEQLKTVNEGRTISVRAGIYVDQIEQNRDISKSFDYARIACNAESRVHESAYRFFNSSMENEVLMQDFVVSHIEEALDQGYIRVYYQPQIDVISEKVIGFEALARWSDPEKGMISPGEFIPVLEEYHMTYKLDMYMLLRVAQDMDKLKKKGIEPKPVSFNLSRVDFQVMDPVKEIVQIVQAYNLSENLIRVEITESSVMATPRKMQVEIARFRKKGFEVLMDDFGSGYSSLSTLRDYAFDEIKIDMGFMRKFDNKSKAIVRNVITMAKEIGLKTLCEGVEELEQVEFLREVGCEKIQGYYYGKPQPLASAVELIKNQKDQ